MSQELDRIAQLRKVQEAILPPPDRTWLWAVGIGALCLAGVTVAAVVRMPSTRVELEATTAALSARVSEALDWRGTWPADWRSIQLRNFERSDLADSSASTLDGRLSLTLIRRRCAD